MPCIKVYFFKSTCSSLREIFCFLLSLLTSYIIYLAILICCFPIFFYVPLSLSLAWLEICSPETYFAHLSLLRIFLFFIIIIIILSFTCFPECVPSHVSSEGLYCFALWGCQSLSCFNILDLFF